MAILLMDYRATTSELKSITNRYLELIVLGPQRSIVLTMPFPHNVDTVGMGDEE